MQHRMVLLLFALAACAPSGAPVTGTSRTLLPIRADELRRDLFVFASDSFAGRETGTPSAMKAARFLVDRLVTLGLEPAGDSLYYQRVPLIKETFGPATSFTVTQGQATTPLALGADVAPFVSLGPGAYTKRNAEGDLVFAGYGMTTLGRNDFRGITEEGKAIVMLHAAPASITDSVMRQRLESQAELEQRLLRALQLRPAAIILVMTGGSRDFYFQAMPQLLRSITSAPGDQTTLDAQRPLPMVLIALARPGSLLLPSTWPADDAPQPLTGRRFVGRVDVRRDPMTAHNVAAVVRGSDTRLNKTYVAFGAHYDHVGIQPGMRPDSIANGADDDGSGSVTMLAIAKSLMAARPRRSALFVWHAAEEKGLLGSEYFTDHPTVPIDSIVAQLNADMIGRRGGSTPTFDSRISGALAGDRVYVVGPNAAPNNQSRVLGAILDTVNARQLRPMQFDREWDSPNHPERIFFRSDHYNYARKGIPILFFTTGLHEDYHKVSDEPQKIDYDKMARVGALLLELGTTLGNREARPR
jgi:hypothetical protein